MIFDFLRYGAVPLRVDRHRLAGIITVDGLPARQLVIVFDRVTFVMLAAKWSNPTTGAWEVSGLPQYAERQLLVVSVDHANAYNAEVADCVSQVTA